VLWLKGYALEAVEQPSREVYHLIRRLLLGGAVDAIVETLLLNLVWLADESD